MKIAIVHDYLNQMGGAERVVAVLHRMFPEAPIFTTLVDHSILGPELAGADIRFSWMQRLPGWRKHFKKYLPLYPKAVESFDLQGFDIVLSSSSAFAKGARKGKNARHVCYCYTPMRFVWDSENYLAKEELPWLYRRSLPFFIRRLRKWDLETSIRPDRYVAISSEVRRRIQSAYGVDARVVFPPVDTEKFKPGKGPGRFYLIVSRLASYKRIEIAIQAFNRSGLPLKIIGSGPARDSLRGLSRPNIEFLGRVGDDELAGHYASCKALILPGVEDFGLAPLEANAAGRPAIAFAGGGALDTIRQGINGIFFREPSGESLLEAVRSLESGHYSFSSEKVREHALQFATGVFEEKMAEILKEARQL